MRDSGPWTPAVDALLKHLEKVGFPAVPRLVGTGYDAEGRETLTYIDGDFAHPGGCLDGAAAVGRLIRNLHDAVAAFDPPEDAVWFPWHGRETGAGRRIISHAPWHAQAWGRRDARVEKQAAPESQDNAKSTSRPARDALTCQNSSQGRNIMTGKHRLLSATLIGAAALTATAAPASAHAEPVALALFQDRGYVGAHVGYFFDSWSNLADHPDWNWSDEASSVKNNDTVAWVLFDDRSFDKADRHFCLRSGQQVFNLGSGPWKFNDKTSSIKRLRTDDCSGFPTFY